MTSLLALVAVALFLAAAVSDAASRRIPNRLAAGLALVGLVRIVVGLAAGAGFAAAGLDILAALLVLAAGACAFGFGMLGGGDAKLLAAGALWLGAGGLGPYLLTTILAGGALAAAYVVWQFVAPRRSGARPPAGLPYAIAIAAGGIFTTAGALLA